MIMISPVETRGIHLYGGERIMAYKDPNKAKEYRKIWWEKNKERMQEKKKEYYQQNKEKINKRHSEYRKKHKEKMTAYLKEYREKNREQINEQMKEYYDKNKETLNGKGIRYKIEQNAVSRKTAFNHYQAWTPEEDTLLIKLKKQNKSQKEIAETLGRSISSINMRLVKLRKSDPFNGIPHDDI